MTDITPDPAAVKFFADYAPFSYAHGEDPDVARAEQAYNLARAEAWLKSRDDLRIDWADDWDVQDHVAEFDGYDEQPETCEFASLTNGNVDVLASLGCIDDADADAKRLIEAELALGVMDAEEEDVALPDDRDRVAYTLRRLNIWAGNFATNAKTYQAQGRHDAASQALTRERDCRDLIKMLDGSEDASILRLKFDGVL